MVSESILELLARATALSMHELRAIERAATAQTLAVGDVVLRDGEASAALYLIADGEVAIGIGDGAGTELGRCGAGAVLGEVSLFDGGAATATVTATRATQLLRLDRAQLDALYGDDPHAAAALMRMLTSALAARIRASNDRLEKLDVPAAGAARQRQPLLGVLRSLFIGGPS
jgi:CRP-like cAMP-binding protein|nr:cyclic nucleotide-binding domain-containing protein [Kofleriaceae bacterium]